MSLPKPRPMLFALSGLERASSLYKVTHPALPCGPGRSFLYVSFQINYLTSFLRHFYAINGRLCPVRNLRHYLKATRNFQSSRHLNQTLCFFLYVKSHNPITAPTLRQWLRIVLKNAGIDTDIFKAHSVRGASITAAVNSKIPFYDVMKMADWSRINQYFPVVPLEAYFQDQLCSRCIKTIFKLPLGLSWSWQIKITLDAAVSTLLLRFSNTQPLFCTLRVRALNSTRCFPIYISNGVCVI